MPDAVNLDYLADALASIFCLAGLFTLWFGCGVVRKMLRYQRDTAADLAAIRAAVYRVACQKLTE